MSVGAAVPWLVAVAAVLTLLGVLVNGVAVFVSSAAATVGVVLTSASTAVAVVPSPLPPLPLPPASFPVLPAAGTSTVVAVGSIGGVGVAVSVIIAAVPTDGALSVAVAVGTLALSSPGNSP